MQPFEVVAEHMLTEEARIRPSDVEFLEADFDCHLPWSGGTDELSIVGIANQLDGQWAY